MSLADLKFSDLIILPEGNFKLKGCPETKQQLVSLPKELLSEVEELPNLLTQAVLSKQHIDPETGLRIESCTMRFAHKGVNYRVADIQDVFGRRTWFLRRLAASVPSLKELGLPQYLIEWLLQKEQCQGLVLIAGAQASGKTTTASSLVACRLEQHGGHGVTFENPAELPLSGKWGDHGYCFQTEILGEHELSEHIKRAHRYASPNIIFIGEILTKHAARESLRVALGSKQQLVIATIHGLNVVAAIERLLNWAQEFDGLNACENFANSLLAIIFQDLECEEKLQNVPQYLLLPFPHKEQDKTNAMRITGIRAKLKELQLKTLHEDMRELRNRIGNHGLKAI